MTFSVFNLLRRTIGGRPLALVAMLWLGGMVFQQCAPAPVAEEPKNPWAADMKPSLTIKELMEHFIDPTSDFVFDAVVFDVSDKGTTETAPANEEEWATVERGAWQLAESANLLMIPRNAEPPGPAQPRKPGEPAPQLSGPEIDAKINADRPKWNKFADGLRVASLNALKTVKARRADDVLAAGTEIDRACEACHLEYWYPGDLAAVKADLNKKVTFDPPKK
jgi:hypothetical protein